MGLKRKNKICILSSHIAAALWVKSIAIHWSYCNYLMESLLLTALTEDNAFADICSYSLNNHSGCIHSIGPQIFWYFNHNLWFICFLVTEWSHCPSNVVIHLWDCNSVGCSLIAANVRKLYNRKGERRSNVNDPWQIIELHWYPLQCLEKRWVCTCIVWHMHGSEIWEGISVLYASAPTLLHQYSRNPHL